MTIPRRYAQQPGETEQSPKERRYRNLLQQRFMAVAGTPERLADLDRRIAMLKAELEAPAPVRQARKASTEPSEAEILKAIMALLHRHPKVAKAWRVNSGSFKVPGRDGKVRYVRANTAHGMSDVQAILKSGKSMFIEVKAARGILMPHQRDFLQSMVNAGAIGMVARSVQDVLDALADA